MSRNALYLVIALLAAGVVTLGYMFYQQSHRGIEIQIGDHGISMQGN